MKTKTLSILAALASLALAFSADDDGADLPPGAGREVVAKVCIDCHTAANFRKMRMSEDDWWEKVGDMVDRGAKADDGQQKQIVAYLVANFGKGSKVYINTAPHTELMAVLGFSLDESKALAAYRTGHGAFKDAGDVAKVPGVDAQKVDAQKSKMVF
jgi:competence protein ComEA